MPEESVKSDHYRFHTDENVFGSSSMNKISGNVSVSRGFRMYVCSVIQSEDS